MADAGIGEAAAAEGAKGAGEAIAGEGLAAEMGFDTAAGGAGLASTAEGLAAAAPAIDAGVSNLAATGAAGDTLGGGASTLGSTSGAATPALAPSAAPVASGAVPAGAGAPDALAETVGEGIGAGTPATGTLPPTTPAASASSVVPEGAFPAGTQAPAPVVEGGIGGPGGVAGTTTGPASTDYLSKGLDALKGIKPMDALTAAGLGYNMYSQQQQKKAMGDMQKKVANAVAPLESTQGQLLSQYNSGSLTAADAAGIQDYVAGSKAQIRQQYASMGQANSPQQAQAEAAIDQKAAAMTDQALKNYLTEALQTTGAITGPYAAIAGQQIAADTGLQNAAKGVFNAIGAQQSGRPAGT